MHSIATHIASQVGDVAGIDVLPEQLIAEFPGAARLPIDDSQRKFREPNGD